MVDRKSKDAIAARVKEVKGLKQQVKVLQDQLRRAARDAVQAVKAELGEEVRVLKESCERLQETVRRANAHVTAARASEAAAMLSKEAYIQDAIAYRVLMVPAFKGDKGDLKQADERIAVHDKMVMARDAAKSEKDLLILQQQGALTKANALTHRRADRGEGGRCHAGRDARHRQREDPHARFQSRGAQDREEAKVWQAGWAPPASPHR